MIAHLFKLVWNRKRSNLLIVTEILLSFLVVFSLAATGLYLGQRFREPLGYDYRDVWDISVARNTGHDWGPWTAADAATFRRLLETLESMEQVVAVAGSDTGPYKGSRSLNGWKYRQRDVISETSRATPRMTEVLGLELVEGRWLRDEDSALDWTPVVIDRDLAQELLGDEDPLGKRITEREEDGDLRVVGVVREYRRAGEFERSQPHMFQPADLESDGGLSLDTLLVRLVPGVPADFEQPMLEALRAQAREWSFTVEHLETARERYLRHMLLPLAVVGLVAFFLLVMVVLGLTGVMWQNVTRRTREIGLRRAAGARRADIHRQIVGEVMVTASLGIAVGSLIAIQVPLLGPFAFVPYAVVLPALVGSAAAILGLAALCGLYPGWSAARIRPAEALHYE